MSSSIQVQLMRLLEKQISSSTAETAFFWYSEYFFLLVLSKWLASTSIWYGRTGDLPSAVWRINGERPTRPLSAARQVTICVLRPHDMHKISICELYQKMSLSAWHTALDQHERTAGTDSESSSSFYWFGLNKCSRKHTRSPRKKYFKALPKVFQHSSRFWSYLHFSYFLSIAINLL